MLKTPIVAALMPNILLTKRAINSMKGTKVVKNCCIVFAVYLTYNTKYVQSHKNVSTTILSFIVFSINNVLSLTLFLKGFLTNRTLWGEDLPPPPPPPPP